MSQYGRILSEMFAVESYRKFGVKTIPGQALPRNKLHIILSRFTRRMHKRHFKNNKHQSRRIFPRQFLPWMKYLSTFKKTSAVTVLLQTHGWSFTKCILTTRMIPQWAISSHEYVDVSWGQLNAIMWRLTYLQIKQSVLWDLSHGWVIIVFARDPSSVCRHGICNHHGGLDRHIPGFQCDQITNLYTHEYCHLNANVSLITGKSTVRSTACSC